MNFKTFKYKNYTNCTFFVDSYFNDTNAMYIAIQDEKGNTICNCTTYKSDFLYQKNTATIKNYMETSGMTKFLIKLGIVEQVITKSLFKIFANSKNDSIDYCDINIDNLKKYSNNFNYNIKK